MSYSTISEQAMLAKVAEMLKDGGGGGGDDGPKLEKITLPAEFLNGSLTSGNSAFTITGVKYGRLAIFSGRLPPFLNSDATLNIEVQAGTDAINKGFGMGLCGYFDCGETNWKRMDPTIAWLNESYYLTMAIDGGWTAGHSYRNVIYNFILII